MAAVRFRCDYYSVAGIAYRIDIWDNSHSGAVTDFESSESGAEIRYTAESRERHSPICASECSFIFYIASATHAALITDLAGAAESRFWVALYKSGAFQWAGVVLTDTVRYQDLAFPYPFEVHAADGLAALKDTQYTDSGTRYTGPAKTLSHVLNILGKLPYLSLWGASDEFLRTSVDWWDGNGPGSPAGTDDPFGIYWAQHETFYSFEKGEARVMSCYDVLASVLSTWGARIYQVDGVFWVEQIHVRNASAFYARNYSKSGTQLSVDNATGDNQIDQTNVYKITGLQYEFYPALNKVEVEYEVRNRRNYLAGWDGTNTPPNANIQIKHNSGDAALQIAFGVTLSLTNDTYTVAPSNYVALLFTITLTVGTERLERGATITNFTVNYENAEWQTNTGSQVIVFYYPVIAPVIGQTSQYTIPFDIITPPLNVSGSWGIDITFDGGVDQNGTLIDTSNWTWTVGIVNPYMEVFSYGQPQVAEDTLIYTSTNPTGGNTAILEYKTLVGDADNPNSVGRLLYGTSAGSLVDTTSWGAGVDARNKNIGDLLASTILHGQLTPTRRMLGQVRGTFLCWRRWYQTLDNTYWLMLGGTWTTGQDTFDGEWFRIQYGGGGVSVTPVRRRVNIFPTTSLPTTPSTNHGPGITTQATGNVEGLVIRPLANNTANGAILAGAITSISVNTALETDEYQTGEIVTIYNPINGVFENVTVTADTTNGATTISVTGTLTNGYPNGAYIIKKPVVGITTLPGGDLGDILRHDGTEWTDYNGSNDGYPLVYDSTNGWQEEQLGTAGISNSAVTLAKIQNIATDRLLGRDTAGAGVVEELTVGGGVEFTGSGGVQTGAFTGDVTKTAGGTALTIASDAVTFGKMQNIDTQRVIGRNAAGTGDPESLTLTTAIDWLSTTQGSVLYRNASAWVALGPGTAGNVLTTGGAGANPSWSAAAGGITGSGMAGRIAYWSSTSAITADDFPLYWDATNNRLGIGTETPSGRIHVLIPNGTTETAFTLAGALTTGLGATISNTDNTTASAISTLILSAGGATGGDPVLQLNIAGQTSWSVAVDNSNGDRFAISQNTIPGTNDRFVIDASGYVGINASPASAQLQIGSSTSGINGLTVTGAISGGNQIVSFANTSNTASSDTRLTVGVGGTAAGDPCIQFAITSGTQWSIGSDNSDGDKLKIRAQITPSTGSNQGITVTNASSSLVGINNDTPGVALDATLNTSSIGLPVGTTAQRPAVNHSIRGNSTVAGLEYRYGGFWHRLTSQATPSYTVGAAAGTGATGNVTGSNDLAGQISFTTGATGLSTGTVFTVTFGQQHDPSIFTWIVFAARNAAAALEINKFYLGSSGNTAFTLAAAATLTASTTYTLSYMVRQ